MKLYAATTNSGKLRDFAAAAEGAVEILPLPSIREIPEPVEDALTFAGNAEVKAIYYSKRAPGFMVMADDSGLEVNGLDGAPGVRSARFADDHSYELNSAAGRDQRNNDLLVALLREMPGASRSARFVCALAVARDGQIVYTAEGYVAGEILPEPRGDKGFGYDPLFLLPELNKTTAELDADEKWRHSHRGRAFRNLLPGLIRLEGR